MDDELRVTYYGHVFDASGYGEAARAYIHALHTAGVTLSVVDLTRRGRQVQDELVESLLDRRLQPDFHLFHGIPPQWARLAFPLANAIGMTVWETDTMPPQWHNILSHVADVWLPCAFNVETFRRGLDRAAFRLPHPMRSRHVNGERAWIDALTDGPDDFVFYSIFEWQDRKGPRELLRAYFDAFPRRSNTLLLLKTNPAAEGVANAAVDEIRRATGSDARVRVIAASWTPGHLEALHARGDCYVSLHRGEGWGYPLFDAAARGVPAVATAFSGPLDYLAADAAHLLPYHLVPVRQPYLYYSPQMQWAMPDVEAAAHAMRDVHDHPEAARARARELGQRIREAYSLERVGRMAADRLRELAAVQTRAVARRDSASLTPPRPPVPIPASWYDEDYFEHGVTSNWRHGYSWSSFGGLFRETAAFLIELFPHATSYLDAGCAKGFLVRALREAGRESWGVDHSAWAVAHADEVARPFITQADVVDGLTRQVDVLVALDLLSELTEEQVQQFLQRARESTSTAIVAAMPSYETAPEESQQRASEGRDRTHITMRPRGWWHEQFLAAGWKQDALHRLGAESCRSHPLSRRMKWHVYAYAAR